MTDVEKIIEGYKKAGQSHLFKYWDSLTQEEKDQFVSDLGKIKDPSKYMDDVKQAMKFSASAGISKNYKPLPKDVCYSSLLSLPQGQIDQWYETGLKAISEGKVGVVLMAGGQGTRLGSSSPKGMYDVGLPSHKSLFQLQSERILKLRQLASKKYSKDISQIQLPFYIMTSEPTRDATEKYFVEHKNFGLGNNVIFFNQGTLPAVTMDGKRLLLGSKNSLAESPDGNGGFYKALYDNGILEDFKRKGIEYIHAYCVDNILVKVADPIFIGYASSNDYDIATKVVRKTEPSEQVGLIVLEEKSNAPCVVEYSEISKELSEMKDPDNASLLKFRAANIVNHFYKTSFLQKEIPEWITSRSCLPYHVAKKKIKCLNEQTGEIGKPKIPNGIKLEQFIFDVFPSVKLEKFGCLEVDRNEEFSPLKNAPGSSSSCPETCKKACLERSTKWLKQAGAKLGAAKLVEVEPLTSYDGEGLEFVKDKNYTAYNII